MADYEKRYRLQSAPQARLDGSGNIDYDIFAEYRLAGSENAWVDIPGRHKTVSVPAGEIAEALAAGTTGQKVTAYKQALAANINTLPQPINGWSLADLEALLDANDQAADMAELADTFIRNVAPTAYPVWFAM